MYILVKGLAKETVRNTKTGAEATVGLLKPGNAYGLVPLMDGQECCSSLVTLQPCEFLVLDRETFRKEVEEHPEMYRQALDLLCYQVRQAHQWIESLL